MKRLSKHLLTRFNIINNVRISTNLLKKREKNLKHIKEKSNPTKTPIY